MEFEPLGTSGAVLVKPRVFADDRGFFLETYKYSEFAAAGIDCRFVQENHSFSTARVIRGLHFQRPPRAQAKLVRVVQGAVWDVAVDMRRGAETFGKWVAAELSATNRYQLYLPSWCAHGFCVLTETAEVVYKVSAEYAPQSEGGVLWNDEDLRIAWPERNPELSARDRKWPTFQAAAASVQQEGEQR
jgi:dTDP-4-dehydrorhamnose 3,5-epimerase